MQLSALPYLLLSSLVLNSIGSLAIAPPPVGPPGPPGGKVVAPVSTKKTDDAPPDLKKYQKDNEKELAARLRANRDAALKSKGLPGDVLAYTQGKLRMHHYSAIQGMKLGGGTVFTNYKVQSNIMHESDTCYVIMNGKSPFMRSYLVASQHNAGQSFLHFLVIPKRNVYNGAVLSDGYWINESQKAFREFLRKPDWHRKATRRVKHYIDKATIKHKEDATDWKLMTAKSKHLGFSDFAFAYHINQDASIGHLHMHVVASNPRLRALSSKMHDEKDVPPHLLLADIKAHPIGGKEYPLWTPRFIEAAQNKPHGTRRKLRKMLGKHHPKRSPVEGFSFGISES